MVLHIRTRETSRVYFCFKKTDITKLNAKKLQFKKFNLILEQKRANNLNVSPKNREIKENGGIIFNYVRKPNISKAENDFFDDIGFRTVFG